MYASFVSVYFTVQYHTVLYPSGGVIHLLYSYSYEYRYDHLQVGAVSQLLYEYSYCTHPLRTSVYCTVPTGGGRLSNRPTVMYLGRSTA